MPTQKAPSATKALVFGLIGFFCCPIVGIFAIIYGGKTKKEIAASGGMLDGSGLGTAGQILGWIAIAFWIAGIVIGLATGAVNTSFQFGTS